MTRLDWNRSKLLFPVIAVIAGFALLAAVTHMRSVISGSDTIDDRLTLSEISILSDHDPKFPPFLYKPRDVYLLIRQGGAFVDIRLLAGTRELPERLASVLTGALRGSSLAAAQISTTDSGNYSAARAFFSQSRWGALSASTTVTVGHIVSAIQSVGYTPHAILIVPRYAAPPLLPVPGILSKKNRLFDITRISPSLADTVHAGLVPGGAPEAGWALLRFLLTIALGLGAAVLFSRLDSISLKLRRKLFDEAPVAAAMTLFLPGWGPANTLGYSMADLWYGNFDPFHVANVSVVGIVLLLFLMMPLEMWLKHKCLGSELTSVKALSAEKDAALSAVFERIGVEKRQEIERRAKRSTTLVVGGLLLTLVVPFMLPVESVWTVPWALACAVLVGEGFMSVGRRVGPKRPYGSPYFAKSFPSDEEIRRQAQDLVARSRERQAKGNSSFSSNGQGGDEAVGPFEASDGQSEGEREFRIVQAMLSGREKKQVWYLPAMVLAACLLAAPYALSVLGVLPTGLLWSFFYAVRGFVVLLIFLAVFFQSLSRRQTHNSVAALRITRNLPAAEAFVNKTYSLTSSSDEPAVQPVAKSSMARTRDRQIAALRKEAKKLRLTE
ncbi:MAG TPA: hypothetical protein VFW40_07250 [Capsulimonadaceae bacterium]|nr:hypothetical protein [Capsulimonadaceae bacterium]